MVRLNIYVQSQFNAQNYNRYSYCFNNPMMFTDPTGWKTETHYRDTYMIPESSNSYNNYFISPPLGFDKAQKKEYDLYEKYLFDVSKATLKSDQSKEVDVKQGAKKAEDKPASEESNPSSAGDPNQRIKVYIETDGFGHAYMQVSNTVYDYGEWNDIGNFKLVGDGVLLKFSGKEATDWIAKRQGQFPTNEYSIYNLDAANIQSYYEGLWSNGSPLSADSQFYNNGRVVDTFVVPFNTCAVQVLNALFQGGAPSMFSPIVTPTILESYLKNHGYK